MSTINPVRRNNRYLDMTVFLAILATGILLILLHVPAGSLGTIATALSGLYGTWIGVRHSSRPPAGPPRYSSNRRTPTDPADTTEIDQPVS
ncbi:hypothetical protein ABT288_47715 [Streptomyces sp. NPDC001093]|uniref:hypothetical protein n=1 Tax=Streptomyces sp. NPDC001093 TaxID=3154376 RepID=UPI00332BCCDA